MCALFGWLDCGKKLPHKLLKKFTQELANAAEERGTDARGISYVNNGKVTIYKKAKPAHKMKFNFPEGTTAVMGHTRLTTQGNQKYNFNNHPFYGKADKEFAFAHNGVLYNDKTLRKEKNLPDTHIETDSYVAVQLIEQQRKLDFESLKSMAETVSGSFCFTALDEYNSLYIVKGSNPMCLLHFEELGLYIYASTETIMTKALKKAGLHKMQCYRIEVNEGDIIKLDYNGNLSCSQFEIKDNFKCNKWFGWYKDFEDDDLYNEHEQMLLEICSYYGIDEDDVLLLLDYGYTADEIEDMLCDHSLIHDTVMAITGEEDYSDYLVSI